MPSPDDQLLAGVAGTRVEWAAVPGDVRRSIEARLGSRVASADRQPAGFSPALAARAQLEDGRRVFLKAIAPDEQSGAPGGQRIYRREAQIASALPAGAPVPRLIDSFEADGWVALVFEDLPGANPSIPWRADDLDRVLHALVDLAACLTPAPVIPPPSSSSDRPEYWRLLAEAPAGLDPAGELAGWCRARLDLLVVLEAAAEGLAAGDTLLHGDVRADNILLTPGRVYFVDWPHARAGAAWLDLLWLLPSVAMQGGPAPDRVFGAHPLARGLDHRELAPALVAFAGFMLYGANQPPPPGLPGLPRFQLAQAREALKWLQRLLA